MEKVLATARQRVLYEARELWGKGFVTFDTETTGLGLESEDEIIQWAVCSQEGEVLGSGFVKPTIPISEGAFEKHGISDEQLIDAPTFAEVWPTIRALLADKMVVIYNASFDRRMIWSSARPYKIEIPHDFMKCECAMELFARFYGEVHEYWGTHLWQKLNEVAIPYLEIDVPGQAHSAAHDAAATALIVKKLAELADQELPLGWHPPVNVPCAGCGRGIRECAEASELWHCQSCSLEMGLFHRCPGCNHIVESPASGFACDDLCDYCQKRLSQEKMLLTGAWHWCPDHWYAFVVETSDLDEPCAHCQRQREWRRQAAETERVRQERMAQERKERRRASAKAYRQRRKEHEQENRRRAELGLPALEGQKRQPVEQIFSHRGHRLERQRDDDGKPEFACLTCEGVWRKPPVRWCAGVKVYYTWPSIPEHLKTKTQLLKLHLEPAEHQRYCAMMETAFDRYDLYDQRECIPLVKRKSGKKTAKK